MLGAMDIAARMAAIAVLAALTLGTTMRCVEQTSPLPEEVGTVTLTVLYDNYESDRRLKPGWGFSCLLQGLEETILFDTGGDSAILLGNMRALGIEPSRIDSIFLSHSHGDHVGGLAGLLEEHSAVRVYLLRSFPEEFKGLVRGSGAEVVEVQEPMEISPHAWSTGALGTSIGEQSLVLETDVGLVLITGCAHPGIVEIIKRAKRLLGRDVYLALGGFHMLGMSAVEIQEIIAQLRAEGVKKVGPCHCSGDLTRRLFREAYGEDYIEVGVGSVISLE
ncbi:MAG: MBL fold metallo-hydrolase [Candidatus Acetothermia bacterium]|jgi:7,8-dihydropterin-6-yl-methyl-4-(beta-D-ribofuranosyl)aminobenzene 5'-phosphate synthase|nr:MBL fold metallo-hydrolase [Candidatus Acetothermia bacterium]MDH7505096.1 MBL fold metallo-hydrolase [Candidatus Acetothermia bacterium]